MASAEIGSAESITEMTQPRRRRRPISLLVVAYNSAAHLPAFLEALTEALAGVQQHEIIVVDNDSSDGSLELARRLRPEVRAVPLSHNYGYAAGVNAGAAMADVNSDLLVLNPDIRLSPRSVTALSKVLEDVPSVGIVVPRLCDQEGRLLRSLRREPTVLRAMGEAFLGGRRAGRIPALGEVVQSHADYAKPGTAAWASGAAMLISRECWKAVGPWDESFFLYSEEVDFALRAKDAGFSLFYEPRAAAIHVGGEAHVDPELWTLLITNRVRFFARRHGRARTTAYWLALTVGEGLRSLRGHRTHRTAFLELVRQRAQLLDAQA